MNYRLSNKNKTKILALGAESQGNFSFLNNQKIFISKDYGDLWEEKNFLKFKAEILNYLNKNKTAPDVVLTDLHPLFRTTELGKELANKYNARLAPVQHHHAHIFGAYGEQFLNSAREVKLKDFIGLAADGTGYGLDGNIWGGEVFKIKKGEIKRLGHLENQTLIGADLGIKEPARMLISILNKFLSKEETYAWVKKYYNENQFNLLYNQDRAGFNCQQTSSTARILDAAALLLGFCGNERAIKHGPTMALEKNSSRPFKLKTKIENQGEEKIILTTPLFEYLLHNIDEDKKRLAATAQLYIAQGFWEISRGDNKLPKYFAGGMANNQIISSYLAKHKVILNKKIPRGDAGISFGQICFFILTNPRN